MENIEFKLLSNLSSYHVSKIADSVIKDLMELKKDLLLSGGDSGLKNTWEEICVQVQGEQSFYWDSYEETINNFIEKALDEQPEVVRKLIMYVAGIDIEPEGTEDEPVYSWEAAINCINDEIIMNAGSFENRNVTRYLDQDFEEEDEEDEENEEEVDEDEAGDDNDLNKNNN